MKLDLHLHTTASDGEHSPQALIQLAEKAGISVLAITDHDTTAGLAEAQSAGYQAGITVIPGIEISTKSPAEAHILGYHINPQYPALQKFCREAQEERFQRKQRILDYLTQFGIQLKLSDVEQYTTDGKASRPHFARALVEKGYADSVQDAFNRYLGIPAFQSIERPKPDPQRAIQLILDSGGVPVLAHPASLMLSGDAFEKKLLELADDGLCGMECFSSIHKPAQTGFYLSLCKKYHLIATGGTDYHGEHTKPDIQLWSGKQGNVCFDDASVIKALSRNP